MAEEGGEACSSEQGLMVHFLLALELTGVVH